MEIKKQYYQMQKNYLKIIFYLEKKYIKKKTYKELFYHYIYVMNVIKNLIKLKIQKKK